MKIIRYHKDIENEIGIGDKVKLNGCYETVTEKRMLPERSDRSSRIIPVIVCSDHMVESHNIEEVVK